MSEAARPQPHEVWETRDGERFLVTHIEGEMIRGIFRKWNGDTIQGWLYAKDVTRLVHSFAHLMTPEAQDG